MAQTKSSFAAVFDPRARLLVLGSLPGEASLALAQYYAHPQNQFWRLMAPVIGHELAGRPYDERLESLKAAGVALWDTIAQAQRAGSLDTAIRAHRANPLAEFVSALPRLRAVAFNGMKASQIGRRELAGVEGIDLVTLPSSSPALAIPFDRKQAQWLALKPYLA